MSAIGTEPATKPPVLLPHVRVLVDGDGSLSITIDREPYDVPTAWVQLGRHAVPQIFEEIATRLGSPMRVEVTDNGATFTDIITSSEKPLRRATTSADKTISLACEIAGSGFSPDERVAIAVVVGHQAADADGVARLRIPPSLLAHRPGLVVLLGKTSGAVVVSGGTA